MTLSTPAKALSQAPTSKTLQASGALLTRWSDLHADVSQRMGRGLHRSAQPVPAMILPTKLDTPVFDELTQTYHWPARDEVGDRIDLMIGEAYGETLIDLMKKKRSDIGPMLVIGRTGRRGLEFTPVSCLLASGSRLKRSWTVFNIGLDYLARGKRLDNYLDQLRAFERRSALLPSDPLHVRLDKGLDGLVEYLVGPDQPDRLARQARILSDAGLPTIGAALERVTDQTEMSRIMKAAFLLSETRALSTRL